jgi:hypothetical protein
MLLSLLALILSVLQLGTITRNPIFFRSMAVSGLNSIPLRLTEADVQLVGTALSLLATIFALVNFVQARNRFNAAGVSTAVYGPALWMGMGGTIAALLA